MTLTSVTSRTVISADGAAAPEGGLPVPDQSLLLDVKNLRVSFAGKEVVRGIDFSVALFSAAERLFRKNLWRRL